MQLYRKEPREQWLGTIQFMREGEAQASPGTELAFGVAGMETHDIYVWLWVFILKQAAAFPAALGRVPGHSWGQRVGPVGDGQPPGHTTLTPLSAGSTPQGWRWSYSPTEAGEQQFPSHRQEHWQCRCPWYPVFQGQAHPTPCRGCSRVICEQESKDPQNAKSSWMASA